jgi:hypothetical protein
VKRSLAMRSCFSLEPILRLSVRHSTLSFAMKVYACLTRSRLLVRSVFVLNHPNMGLNSWRPWRLSTQKCPRERPQLNDFFQLSRGYGTSTGSEERVT